MEIKFFLFHQRAVVSACDSGERSELVQFYCRVELDFMKGSWGISVPVFFYFQKSIADFFPSSRPLLLQNTSQITVWDDFAYALHSSSDSLT